MSKMSKTIAILGVVAGLGVAALPLSSYAVDPTEIQGTGTPLSASKDVPVQLTIKETLSMWVTNEAGDADFTSPVVLGDAAGVSGPALVESAPIAIKVRNSTKEGYNLTLAGSAAENATGLTNATTGSTAVIATGDLTSTTASQWGYKVKKGATGSGYDATWQSVQEAVDAATIDTLGAAGVNTTLVKFGVNILDGQEAGTYNGQVKFTATAIANTGA